MNWKKLLLIAAVAGAFTFAAAAKSEARVRRSASASVSRSVTGIPTAILYAGYYPTPTDIRITPLWIRIVWLCPGGLWPLVRS